MFRARSIDGVRSKVLCAFCSLATSLVACSGASDNGLFQNSGGSGGSASGQGGVSGSAGGVVSFGGTEFGGASTVSGGASAGGAATEVEGGAASGGTPTSGGTSAHGGASSGGQVAVSGGAESSLGGAPAAGAASGGATPGGSANTAGAESGGSAGSDVGSQGGAATGGANVGGVANGGTASGGVDAGGASSGSGGATGGLGGGATGGVGGSATGGVGGSATGGGPNCQKSTEICDGVDNDCNDVIDEKSCPAKCTGFVAGGHRYMACATSVNETAAASACEKQSMRLAWLDSADEASAVLAALQKLGTQGPGSGFVELYIGASDAEQEGHWHWIGGSNFWLGNANGSPVDGAYSNWSKNRPNNYPAIPGENCAVTIVDYPSDGEPGQWNDVECTELHGVLCEVP